MEKVEIQGNDLKVYFRGNLTIKEDTILQFHPSVAGFLKEVKGKGYRYGFSSVYGTANATVDLSRAQFNLNYVHESGPVEEMRGRPHPAYYEIEGTLDKNNFAAKEITSVDSFNVDIHPFPNEKGSMKGWKHVSCSPLKNQVHSMYTDILGSFHKDKANLVEEKGLYEVAKWLIEEKKFAFNSKYDHETYKKLTDMFNEGGVKVKLLLDVTIKDESKFGNIESLKEELYKIAEKKGALVEIEYATETDGKKPQSEKKP